MLEFAVAEEAAAAAAVAVGHGGGAGCGGNVANEATAAAVGTTE